MAQLQTLYNETIGVPYAGSAANGEGSNDISLHLEGAVDCAFGRPVYRGAGDKGAILTPTANTLRGFAMRQQGLSETSGRPLDSYKSGDADGAGDTMLVRERGSIYIASTTAAADGDAVFVTPAGGVSNVSAGNTAATGWVYDQTIAAAGLAIIVRR